MSDIPYTAIANNEPLPKSFSSWPQKLQDIVKNGRTEAGWCDHGKQFTECEQCG